MLIDVERDTRKIKRDAAKPLLNDFLKYITEIILNSDDSYSRIEQKINNNILKTIDIKIDRKKRSVQIVDNAEGMSSNKLQNVFKKYGAENSQGDQFNNVRGLFGQGASDVLFSAPLHNLSSFVISFYHQQVSKVNFYFNDKQQFDVEAITKNEIIEKYRIRYGIPKNGTIVYFELPKDVSIPQSKHIKLKIENYYMLRFVLSNPNRQVKLRVDGREYILDSSRFLPKTDDLIRNENKTFNFKTHTLKIELNAYKSMPSAEKDETQILIIDENNVVYDNTDVDIGIYHGFKDIRIIVKINGIYRVLRHYLNMQTPQELLRDSRDGFDKRNIFTKKLFSVIKEFTIQVLDEQANLRKRESISLKENIVFRNLIQEINKIYRELELRELGFFEKGSAPPLKAIEFVRSEASITHKKQYNLKILINNNLANSKEFIDLNINSEYITFTPNRIFFGNDTPNDLGLIIKNIVIKGNQITDKEVILTAFHQNDETSIKIKVIEEEIYYPELIEIRPSKAHMKPGATKKFKIFINTDFFPFYSYVYIEVMNSSNNEVDKKKYQFSDENLVSSNIVVLDYELLAPKDEETLYLKAICNGHSVKIKIEVFESNNDNEKEGLDGKFKDIELIDSSRETWQTEYRPDTGKIFINKNNPINANLLSPIENIEKKDLLTEKQKLYLFDLVCIESARMIHLNKDHELSNETFEKRFNSILEMKTSIFKKIID